MCQHAQVALALAGGVGPAAQGAAERPLVPAEGALRLPALAVDALVPAALGLLAEALHHLPPVPRPRPLAPVPASVQRDHCRAHAQFLAAVVVAVFAVERAVGQHPVVRHHQRRLGHHRTQLWRVVGRTQADGRAGQEVAGRLTGDGQLRPESGVGFTAGAFEEVAGGLAAVHAGGIDGGGRLVGDQAALLGADGGLQKEQDEFLFFYAGKLDWRPTNRGRFSTSVRLIMCENAQGNRSTPVKFAGVEKNGVTKRKIEYWVIPPEQDGEFVACMEEVLETYAQAYDPQQPVLCMDEQPIQLYPRRRRTGVYNTTLWASGKSIAAK
jgi:hypothetical protein